MFGKKLLLCIVGVVLANLGFSATFNVNTTADTIDASPGDGICADSNGQCSLRAAVMEANALGGYNVINLHAGSTYVLTIDNQAGDDDTGAEDDLDTYGGTIVINGNGATITRSGGCGSPGNNRIGEFRIFHVRGGELQLNNIAIRNGCAVGPGNAGWGGGVYVSGGSLKIKDSRFRQNIAVKGGGIYTNSNVNVTNTIFYINSGYGSCIYIGGGHFHIFYRVSCIDTYWSGIWVNTSTSIFYMIRSSVISLSSMGIRIDNGWSIRIESSTIVRGTILSKDPAIYITGGSADIKVNFITANSIFNNGKPLRIKNSIVFHCGGNGTFNTSGTNYSIDPACSNFTVVTQQDLFLRCRNNTVFPSDYYCEITPNSVALDAATDCTNQMGYPIDTDQRGVPRPQGPACDVGAFELEYYSVTVNNAGNGTGMVTSNPAGINCGSTCTAKYSKGSQVTLTATPDAYSLFNGWGGDCSSCGTNTVCTITVDTNKNCTANFGILPNQLPAVNSFTATPSSETAPLTVTFSWSVSDPDGDVLTCYLDVNGDGINDYTVSDCANNTPQTHTYNNPGTYTVKLTVDDGRGGTASQIVTVTVSAPNNPPVINSFITNPNSGIAPLTVTFSWNVSDPDGDILTCYLDINNDGVADYIINDCANNTSQDHTYSNSGNYTAVLTVDDGKGRTDSGTVTITVSTSQSQGSSSTNNNTSGGGCSLSPRGSMDLPLVLLLLSLIWWNKTLRNLC